MTEAQKPPQGRISLIFTDIEDSTRMTRALGSDIYAREMREPHCHLIRQAIAAHSGYEVKTIGDSFMIAFDHANEAIACADGIQKSLANPPVTCEDDAGKIWTVKVRIGVHTSLEELIPRPDAHGRPDYGGDDVNFAARVESLGAGGQVIVSDSSYEAAGSRQRYSWKEWPGRRIKSFDQAETVWELLWDGGESRGEPGVRWFPDWFMGERNRYIPRPALQDTVLHAFAHALPSGSALRLVTLHASGGMGKTRLAVACAVQAAGQFPDGVCLIALDGRTPTKEALAEAIAAEMGLEAADAQPDRLLELLRDRRSLLLLDNYESVKSDAVRQYVGSLLTGTRHLRLLVTGREPVDLSDVEQMVSLEEGLAADESRELFLARARLKKGPDWQPLAHEDAPLAEILVLTERIPLAIELAAAWVGKRTIAEVAKGLRETELGDATRDPGHRVEEVERHRSLTRSLDWSFLLLGEDADGARVLPSEGVGEKPFGPLQEGFARLGVFPNTFTVEAAAEVCDRPDAQDVLDRLVDCALLRRTEDDDASRYGMHRFTRAYSIEKLQSLPEARLTQGRFIEYYRRLVINNHDLNDAKKRAVLDAEWANAVAAARVAADLGLYKPVWSVSEHLGDFLLFRGWWSEYENLGALALSAAKTAGDRAAEGRALNNLGIVYRSQGRWQEAENAYQKSLVICREFQDRAEEGKILTGLGNVYASQGRWQEAEDAHEKSLVIERDFKDQVGEGMTLNNLGGVYASQGRWQEAEDAYQKSLVIERDFKDRVGEGNTLNNLGGVYYGQGRWQEAEDAYQKSLEIRREFKDRLGEGQTLVGLGNVYTSQGRWQEAEDAHEKSLVIEREFKDRVGEGQTLNNLGNVYDNQGRWQEAEDAYQRSLMIRREFKDHLGEGQTLNNLGNVYASQGRWQEAEEAYQKSLAILREFKDRVGEGKTLKNLALLSHTQGNVAGALELARKALAVLETTEDEAAKQKARGLIAHWEQEVVGTE